MSDDTNIPDDIMAAAKACFNAMQTPYMRADFMADDLDDGDKELIARAILAERGRARRDALEEAAKLVDDEDGEYSWAGLYRNIILLQQHSRELAAAIRALAEKGGKP